MQYTNMFGLLMRDKRSSTDSLSTMSRTITLFCWVIHTPTKQIFSVKIARDELWSDVKDAIKKKKKNKFNDIDADTLDLWKVCHCAVSHVVMLNSQFERSPSVVPNFLS